MQPRPARSTRSARCGGSRARPSTVVMAADGYPSRPRKGDLIAGLDEAAACRRRLRPPRGHVVQRRRPAKVETSGGRVLAVTAVGDSLAEARDRAYQGVGLISFDGAQSRTDIAQRAAAESA